MCGRKNNELINVNKFAFSITVADATVAIISVSTEFRRIWRFCVYVHVVDVSYIGVRVHRHKLPQNVRTNSAVSISIVAHSQCVSNESAACHGKKKHKRRPSASAALRSIYIIGMAFANLLLHVSNGDAERSAALAIDGGTARIMPSECDVTHCGACESGNRAAAKTSAIIIAQQLQSFRNTRRVIQIDAYMNYY